MKLCRFQPLEFASGEVSRTPHEARPGARAGIIEDGAVWEIPGEVWQTHDRTGRKWPLDGVRFLPPSAPSKIVCVGRNYLDHAKELGNDAPKEPLIFLKPPSSVIAPEEPIIMPAMSHRVDYEGEIAVIIGRRCSHRRASEKVQPYLAGFACLNDVTARDLQRIDDQWTRAKGFDTFCPFGPVLETELDLDEAMVETFVNGVRKQSGRAADMIFPVDVIIRWISQVMTLEPGDVVATGTPAGIGPLAPGDVVEVSVSGIGTLRNPVIGPKD